MAMFVATLAAAGILIGWLASRGPRQSPPQAVVPERQPATVLTNRSLFAPVHPPHATAVGPATPTAESGPNDTQVVTNWEEKVDAALREPGTEDETARKLLDLFPRLPEAGQIEAAKHIANLISDEDYPKLARYLTDSTSSAEVAEDLFADLLNRPNSVKLPTLLEIASNAKHPKAEEAKGVLKHYLDEDYGEDWKLWEQRIAVWLKDNPD